MTARPNHNILNIPVLDLYDEPTVCDFDLGVRLGFDPPTMIRRTISRHRAELEVFGVLRAVRTAPEDRGSGCWEVTEYYLTESQALCLCQVSCAPLAAAVRRMMLTAFRERCRDRGAPTPAGRADASPRSHPVPSVHRGANRLHWQGHSISTDLSRLDPSQDVVVLLPDSRIDTVRLASPPCGTGGRQGVVRRPPDPNSTDRALVMVTILGPIVDDGWR